VDRGLTAVRSPAATYNVTGTGTVYTGAGTFRGCSIGSTAGAAVVIYDNTSASGTVLASFTLAANGFEHVDIPAGARFVTGIHLTASAAVQGHVRIG
jgi:hypothetical protein